MTSFGRLGAGNQDGADHQVGLLDRVLEIEARRVAGLDAAAVLGVDLAQGVDVQVEDGDAGAHALGDGGGVVACHSAADHHNVGRRYAGDAAHQDAAPAVGAHQVVGADLRGEAARDLTHRGQQWQRAVGGLHGFVGDRRGAGRHQRIRARLGGGKVQVGEQGLALAQAGVLGLDRLLDLQQQIGLGPHLVDAVDHLGARALEVGVGDRRALARAGLE